MKAMAMFKVRWREFQQESQWLSHGILSPDACLTAEAAIFGACVVAETVGNRLDELNQLAKGEFNDGEIQHHDRGSTGQQS